MAELPVKVIEIARHPDSCKVFTTINEDGSPHSIVCASLFIPDGNTIGIGHVWLNTTGKNLERDPRAEFVFWMGRYAYAVQVKLRGKSDDPSILGPLNERLDRWNIQAKSVYLFDVISVTDEGFSPDRGKKVL